MKLGKAVWQGVARAVNTMTTRWAEGITVNTDWAKPVSKTSGHVSGDHLAHYRREDMPTPSIWRTLPAPLRQPWIPVHIPDEHVKDYEESFEGTLARLGWQEKQITGEQGMTDIARSVIDLKRDDALTAAQLWEWEQTLGWPVADGHDPTGDHREFCARYGHAADYSRWPLSVCARCGQQRKEQT